MIEILTAAAVFGFSLGFSQEMAKDLRRMIRRHRRRTQRSTNICEFKTRATITTPPSSTPPPGCRRVYYDAPSTIAECGGPCSAGGPEFCDCGALWLEVPEILLPKRKHAHPYEASPADTCPPEPQ